VIERRFPAMTAGPQQVELDQGADRDPPTAFPVTSLEEQPASRL